MNFKQLEDSEIKEINGGFVCGGLCVGTIFVVSFLVGAGATIAVAAATKPDEPKE
jgi:hypothetical protein